MATHYTTIAQAQAYHHQPPVASDHLEALVSCQLRQDKNPDRERMLVVNALKRATKNVEKKLYIAGSQSSYYSYVNGGGGRILAEITQLRKASEDQAVKLDSLKKEYSAKLEASGKKLSSIVEWAATMKQIQGVGISIRKCFFHNYMKSVGMASAKHYRAILKANKVAHHGDFQTDTLLTKLGHLGHTRAFKDLYGVPYKRAEYYMKSNMIINIINKRATMIANRRRISRKWDEQLQSDFENMIVFFHNASEEEWGRFEKDEASAEKIPITNSPHPLSWPEVEHVRNLLRQRFQMVAWGNEIPKHLPDTILRRAQYLPQISARNNKPLQITKHTTEDAYLRIYIESAPAPDIKPRQIYFEIRSHDIGNVKPSQRDGPYGKSDTFFEVEIHSALTGITQRIPLQKNFHGSRCLRTHKITWDIHGADSTVSDMISALMPGDELRVFAKSSGDFNINYVESMEMRVIYHYFGEQKGPIPAPGAGPDGRQSGHSGGVSEKPDVPHHQHANGVTASDRGSTSGSPLAASSDQQLEKPLAICVPTPPPPRKRGFRDILCGCFGES